MAKDKDKKEEEAPAPVYPRPMNAPQVIPPYNPNPSFPSPGDKVEEKEDKSRKMGS